MEQIRDLVIQATDPAHDRAERLSAFGALVERFQDMACGYAYSILGDFHQAEDAAQEAFVIAFQQIATLQEPAAFGGWLRRLVHTACSRATRKGQLPTTHLDAAASIESTGAMPGQVAEKREMRDEVLYYLRRNIGSRVAEKREMRDEVLEAIGRLPPPEREVTTLFYINGYSQQEVAEFLEVPVSTVKNRLHASRERLKERMLHMVKETLHDNAPDERFSRKIIDELLAWPQPLAVEAHPVRQVYEALRRGLPNYEVVEGEEIVDRAGIANPWTLQFAFPAEKNRMLRTETTVTTFGAMVGRTPPVRLITAGRAFRNAVEDRTRLKVFHEFNLVCIESGAGQEEMKRVLQSLVQDLFGLVSLRYEGTTLPALAPCYKVLAELQQGWRGVAGCGVFKASFLQQAGYDPAQVSGYAVAMELENVAMLKWQIDDVRKLWQPPYVPQ